MTSDNTNQPVDDVIYLASCAVREISPDPERVRRMDLDQVFHEARRQMLAACCAFALESVDMCTEDFKKAKNKAVRKTVLFDIQRKEVLDRLEEAGIWYMPLKGAVLKDCYPSIGMREMSDNDILFDASRAEDVRKIMLELDFDCERTGKGAHDNYHKAPLYNFEMHRKLFALEHEANIETYYENVKDRLVPDEGKRYGYHFSPEDFYLFMVAHEYKHYVLSGTGLRNCFDIYVYLNRVPLDMDYVQAEAEKAGIASFERANRSLSFHIVEGADISNAEAEILDRMLRSGIYGNTEARVEHKLLTYGGGTIGKARYLLERAFPPMDQIKAWYPFFYKHKLLLPLVPFVRLGKAVTVSRHKVASEIKSLRKGR